MTNLQWAIRFVGQVLYEAGEKRQPFHVCCYTASKLREKEVRRLTNRQNQLAKKGKNNA